jgi:F1F0 ATPase subunit 2
VSGAGTNGIALAVGALLGAVFFGGLWWTVRNAVTASNPAPYFLASLLLRAGIVLTGFYSVSGSGLLSVLLCLCGFIIARVVVTRITRPHFKVRHAP